MDRDVPTFYLPDISSISHLLSSSLPSTLLHCCNLLHCYSNTNVCLHFCSNAFNGNPIKVVDPSRHGDKRKRQAKKRAAIAKQTSLQLYGLFEPPYRGSNASVMPQPSEAEEENDQNITMRIER